MTPEEKLLSDVVARSFALRDAVAYLIARDAARSGDPEGVFREVAEAMDDRLDELPHGISDLKEKVRAEIDWTIGAARAFLALRKG